MAARKSARKAVTDKTCKQMTDLVFDYLKDKLSASVKRDFRQHLRLCPDCVSFLNTYKKTVSVARSIHPEEIPAPVRKNILDFLLTRARKSGTGS